MFIVFPTYMGMFHIKPIRKMVSVHFPHAYGVGNNSAREVCGRAAGRPALGEPAQGVKGESTAGN